MNTDTNNFAPNEYSGVDNYSGLAELKETDNCIKITMRKVNNPCTRIYKHHCFIPGGNSTSPSLMFLSLKLDIRGLNPQSSITLPLGVATKYLAKVRYGNEEHARIYL